jgi:hypothetical protein
VTEGAAPRPIESVHSRDGLYCVDVIATEQGFALQVCRRDEGDWQVIAHRGTHPSRETAIAAAQVIAAALS